MDHSGHRWKMSTFDNYHDQIVNFSTNTDFSYSRSMDADKTEDEQNKRDNEYILETTEEQRRLYNLIRY